VALIASKLEQKVYYYEPAVVAWDQVIQPPRLIPKSNVPLELPQVTSVDSTTAASDLHISEPAIVAIEVPVVAQRTKKMIVSERGKRGGKRFKQREPGYCWLKMVPLNFGTKQ